MTEEVKELRCAVADLIGENERLKNRLSLAEDLLAEASNTLDDIHGYETEAYIAIEKYFEEEDE